MKFLYSILISTCLLWGLTLHAENPGDIAAEASPTIADRVKVVEAGICLNVDKERQPIGVLGPDSRIDTSIHKLYCWTKILNTYDPTEVIHIWYWRDVKRAEVTLPVGRSPGWRTWSSKIIMLHEKGEWRVEILDENRTHIATIPFYLE